MNTQISARHHVEPRIAAWMQPSHLMTNRGDTVMAYQISKRHRTTFQIVGVILLLLFFAAVLVPLFGPTTIGIVTVVAAILIIGVIVGKRGI
jgi:protein-S-isoprenylcysteine O-methyltransferase Ste14